MTDRLNGQPEQNEATYEIRHQHHDADGAYPDVVTLSWKDDSNGLHCEQHVYGGITKLQWLMAKLLTGIMSAGQIDESQMELRVFQSKQLALQILSLTQTQERG